MKKLLIVLFTLITVASYSQIIVDSSGGVKPLGNYPLTSTKYIKGAQQTVTTLEDRNNIPMYLRDTGMLVYVTTLDSLYKLKDGIDNGNWTTLKTGGINGNSKTVFDTVQTTGQALEIAVFSGGGRTISVSTIGPNGSWFLPTYATSGDTTYIDYNYAPTGQVIYKLTILDASDVVTGGGTEYIQGKIVDTLYIDSTGGGGGGGTTIIYRDTTIVNSTGSDTTIYIQPTAQNIVNALGYTPASNPVTYGSISGKPTLSTVATSGLYTDLAGRPVLSTVASTGSYPDLINKPTLATVANTGNYTDLTNKPVLKTVATSGLYTDLAGRPTLSTIATSGLYSDLSGRPTLSTVATSGLYTDLAGRPTLSTIATSGLYSDLSGKPTIPAQLNLVAGTGVTIAGAYPNLTAKLDTAYLNNYLANHSVITSASSPCYSGNVTRFGLISEPFSGEVLAQYQLTQKTVDSLGLTLIRQALQSGSTSNYNAIKALLNSARQVQINIKNTPEDGSRNFTSSTERPAYITYLDTLFRNTLAPASGDTLIVCANEDANATYHTLDTSTNLANQSAYRYWFNELKPMDSISNLYGTHFKVATGGATGPVSWYFVWKNLVDSGRSTDANTIAQAVFAPGTNLATFPTNASYALPIKYTLQLLPYIKASAIDYWNWHIKLVTNGTDSSHINSSIIALGVEAWKNLTGKNIITNELSTPSVNPNNTAEAIAQASKYMDYVLMYDGSSRTSTPTFAGANVTYRNADNSINAIGVNLRNVIQAIKR